MTTLLITVLIANACALIANLIVIFHLLAKLGPPRREPESELDAEAEQVLDFLAAQTCMQRKRKHP